MHEYRRRNIEQHAISLTSTLYESSRAIRADAIVQRSSSSLLLRDQYVVKMGAICRRPLQSLALEYHRLEPIWNSTSHSIPVTLRTARKHSNHVSIPVGRLYL